MGAEIRWGMWATWTRLYKACWILAGIVVLAMPAAAQLEIGDKTSVSMNGSVGVNYDGSIDQGQSSHGLGFTGNANIAGNYYSPNFLNFNVSPFFDRTQTNSVFGSLTNASGVGGSVNLFTGSNFPATFSYSRLENGTSSFGIPGSDIGLATHTNSQGFGIGWGAVVPGWPTYTVSYLDSNIDDTILGEPGTDTDNSKSLIMTSSYKVDSWRFSGQFTHRSVNSIFADYAEPQAPEAHTESSTDGFSAMVQHPLLWTGNFSTTYTHLSYGSHFQDGYSSSDSGGSNTVSATAGFHPWSPLGASFTANYDDNLLGSIPQAELSAGAPLNMTSLGSFHSALVGSDVYYMPLKNLALHFDINHVYQTFLGTTYSATQYGGSVNYNFGRDLLRGLSVSFAVVDTAQQTTNTGMGFVGTLNYSRKFSGWDVNGNFSYAQNVSTALLIYTNSYYSYLGSIKRRLGDHSQWLLGYSASHSGLSSNSGTSSSAERAFTTVFYRMYNFNAFYTKSSGDAIFTASGLVPITTTLPTQVLGNDITQYNAKGFGFGVGATPIRRLTVSASYAKSDGSTIDPMLSSYTNNTLISTTMQYRLRKIWLNGGYTRVTQNLGLAGTLPVNVTSYYVGFSRWFNFF